MRNSLAVLGIKYFAYCGAAQRSLLPGLHNRVPASCCLLPTARLLPLILRRAQNYRMIMLMADTTGETVGLLRRDGSLGYRAWRGFIDVSDARLAAHAVPVKMAIQAFTLDDQIGARWFAVPFRQFLQGCLSRDGVRCVLANGKPRLVSTSLTLTD